VRSAKALRRRDAGPNGALSVRRIIPDRPRTLKGSAGLCAAVDRLSRCDKGE